MRINTILPSYISSFGGVGFACQSILEAMNADGLDARLFCVSADEGLSRSFHRFSMPLWAKHIGYKLFSPESLVRYTEWRYQRSLQDQDIAYLWPGTSIETYRGAKAAGNILLTENINTHQATSKEILDAEYQRLGLEPGHGIAESNIVDENSKLELVDFVFSPSEEVTNSLVRANVPSNKIIPASYGLTQDDIFPQDEIVRQARREPLTAIFVGRMGIRKGTHLLLDYWIKSGVKGKLRLIGNIEPNARHLIEPFLNRDDIEHIPFTRDLRTVYQNADIFLFPSLEEGSPLVTYLALGAGLSSIVSPMGGGGVIRDGDEGLVVDPHDSERWIESIRRIFSDDDYRLSISRNAHNKAEEYLWSNVGRRRKERLLNTIFRRGSTQDRGNQVRSANFG